jgi:hypothetical protein
MRRHGGARHFRSAAMTDSPYGAALCTVHGVMMPTQMNGQEAAQRVDDSGCHGLLCFCSSLSVDLTRKVAAELFHQSPAVLLRAVSEVQIDHGGIDVTVT